MDRGAIGNTGGLEGPVHPSKLTLFVFVACIVAATGGLNFGYDIGISGGVTSMESFLDKFFSNVHWKAKKDQSTNEYCKFDNQLLTIFTSSLYLAALIAAFFASAVTKAFGRKWSMLGGGLTFLVGSALSGAANNMLMLILGRILQGFGIGFANQSIPLYLSEMALARLRGMLNIVFQLMVTFGILVAKLINYSTAKIKGGWGWRVSLAIAVVPAAIITLGALFLPETPNSLIERGHSEAAKKILHRIRGTDNINDEYKELVAASEESKLVKQPWANILKRKYRPQLTMAILIPFFQQFTGINIIMFYAPVHFKTIGFGDEAALMAVVITSLVNVFATIVSIFTVDRLGHRKLFLHGGSLMLVCQIVVGTLIAIEFGTTGEGQISKGDAATMVLFICAYIAGFAWSWGPLGWLVPSEIFPLEVRSAGKSIVVSVNMLSTLVITQAFPTMLCRMKFGLFYFFSGCVLVMTVFIAFFLPETNNVPIEEMNLVWKDHWFWGNFVAEVNIPMQPEMNNINKSKLAV